MNILGEQSSEYKTLMNAHKNYWFKQNKLSTYVGILNALKDYIIFNSSESSQKEFNKSIALHHLIYKSSFKKFLDGYYSDAVESAIKEINTRLKALYKKYKLRELDGADLFAMAFNSDINKTLLIAGEDLTSTSGKDEQEGYRFLFMGLWKGIRNPKAHSNTVMSKEECLERLIFASMLMHKIDACVKKSNLAE